MELVTLLEIQKTGALNVHKVEGTSKVTVGGMELPEEKQKEIVKSLGWLEWAKKPYDIIEKTDKFAKVFNKYLTSEIILDGTTITFQNKRIQDTQKYFDRIKLINSDFDLTILYGMPGTGGSYAVYDLESSFREPAFNCRSLKNLCEFLNTCYEEIGG